MKWFKHNVDADEGKIVIHVIRKYGLEGEARYWRLVGILAKNFDSCKKGWFVLPLEAIQAKLRQRSVKDCTLFLDYLAQYTPVFGQTKEKDFPFIVEYSGNNCRIKYDKIAEIKDNYTKDLQASSKRKASNLLLDKEKEKRERIKNKNSSSLNSSSSKPNIPAVVVEVTNVIRNLKSDLSNLESCLSSASDNTKKVFGSYTVAALGSTDSFTLTGMVREALKEVV